MTVRLHGFLVVLRAQIEVAVLSDGRRTLDVEHARELARRERDAARGQPTVLGLWARYLRETNVERLSEGKGEGSGVWERLTFPDGVVQDAPHRDRVRLIRERFDAAFPDAWVMAPPGSEVAVTKADGWKLIVRATGSDAETTVVGSGGAADFPVDEVISALDLLASAGWFVVHVSEDHGLVGSGETQARVVRARYLLRRERADFARN